ncbi:hypothetical protein [Nonomuraea typhae]|uniref:Uncharacterized protein n=1 Tax=Nonomuraea typhae TaxID=2603600 RepID=A0ABW7YL21_9ACTN
MRSWLLDSTAVRLLLAGMLAVGQKWLLRRARAGTAAGERQTEQEAHFCRDSLYRRVLEEALGLAAPSARRPPVTDSSARLAKRLVSLARVAAYLKRQEDDGGFSSWLTHDTEVTPGDLDRLLSDTACLLRRLPGRLFHVIERAADWVQVHLVGLTRTLLGQGRIVRALPFPARAGRHPPGTLLAAGPHVTRGPTQRGLVPVLSSVRG